MKLLLLILSCMALAVPFASGENRSHVHARDLNFVNAYDLSSMLEKTSFSRILDETLNITGRPKYLRHSYRIDRQLIVMAGEAFVLLPPNVIVKMIDDLKKVLNYHLSMLEKYEPTFARELDLHLKADISRLGHGLRFGVHYLHKMQNGTISPLIKKHLHGLGGYMKWLDSYITSKSLNVTERDLKKTILAVLDIFAKLPNIDDFQRNLCVVLQDKRLSKIVYSMTISKEVAIFHFRGTIKFLRKEMVKKMIDGYFHIPPVKTMIEHFEAVLSNNTISTLKHFFERYGPMILWDKLNLMTAILFRPKGTFTQLKDFEPYLSGLKHIMHRLPKNLTRILSMFDKPKLRNVSVPALIEKMKQPGQVTKACMKMTEYLPKEILQKLRARPNFENDTKAYCGVTESFHQHFLNTPKYMLAGLHHAQRRYNIPQRYLNHVRYTFSPGHIHFVGIIKNNPKYFYDELRHSHKGFGKLFLAAISNFKQNFPVVARRVVADFAAMRGWRIC